jgi:cytochrome c oxidase assembly factor CtaG/polyferredoxin
MDPAAAAVFASWNIPGKFVLLALLASAWIYLHGWRKLHREMPAKYPLWRLTAFFAGLAALLLAIASPLDAFGAFLLQAHMLQHMLLIMVAPPLIWLGQPLLAMVRGLSARLVRDAFSPFLTSPALRQAGRAVTHPATGWVSMAGATIVWHFPRFYELALRSPAWHQTEHACFLAAGLLFWWPVIEVWPSHAQWPRWSMFPYLLFADFDNTGLSAWLTFSSHVVYPSYEAAPRLWGIPALDDQSTAGLIMWVPGSMFYLVPAFLIAMQSLGGFPRSPAPRRASPAFPILQEQPSYFPATALLRHRHLRTTLQTTMFILAAVVAADGFLGPQLAPLNLAGTLPWTYWRGFAVIGLLAAGNLFCMACPITLPRDLVRRFFRPRYRWPLWLRSKWVAVALLALYLWSYESLGLWNSPWLTAWIIAGYFATALAVDTFFEGASFCKYVCPIGQFHFVNSLVSPLEIKVRDAQVCNSCETHDCLRGNARQRGCEMHLFQPRKTGNFDCTFCLDCVHACPQQNVGIGLAVPGAQLRADRPVRPDFAALAFLLTFGAFVNAAGMVVSIRPLFYAAALVAVPGLLAFLSGSLSRSLANTATSWKQLACNFAPALVPLGFSMWIAHFLFHLITGWTSALPPVERLLSLAMTTSIGAGAPAWLTSAQLLFLDAGLLLSLYVAWRIARRQARAFSLLAPWAALLCLLYSAGVWILFQPMQMRGMVMN